MQTYDHLYWTVNTFGEVTVTAIHCSCVKLKEELEGKVFEYGIG
jgi:hypothetical protein